MTKLKAFLKQHGIDAANLDVLFGSGKEAVHGLLTDGTSAVDLWRRLRLAAGDIGHWPVILGSEQDLERHQESFRMMSEESGRGAAMDIVAAGMKVDVATWLTERAAAHAGGGPPAVGEWPGEDLAVHQFTLPVDPQHAKPLNRVYIGLAPTVICWQVPAYLRFGGWNGCPSPEHHIAMLKSWRHTYGAEVVGIGGEVLELSVSRPPEDRASAMRLAREQYVYCPDVVRVGVGTLEARAAMLLGATVWSFWWE